MNEIARLNKYPFSLAISFKFFYVPKISTCFILLFFSVKLQDQNNGPISTFQAMSMSSDTIALENSSAAAKDSCSSSSSKAFLASKSASTTSSKNNNNNSKRSFNGSHHKVDNSEKKVVKIEEFEEKSRENNSIIVVNRGANEGDPPVWTIVNNCTPMKSAVNVITGTRITHGHPLILG